MRHDRRYWFVFVVPVFGAWMALDFVSNAAMLILCGIGYRAGPPISFPPR